jgi:hypothetical protein
MSERITITIETGNSAFDDGPMTEVARILRELANKMKNDGILQDARLFDHNGNSVGWVRIERLTPEPDDEDEDEEGDDDSADYDHDEEDAGSAD